MGFNLKPLSEDVYFKTDSLMEDRRLVFTSK